MNASIMPGAKQAIWSVETRPERVIEQVLDEAARRGERWFSLCRISFILLTVVPFAAHGGLWSDQQIPLGAWIMMPAKLLAIGFSLWVIARTLRGPVPTWVLGLSVAVDATLAFVTLLGNVLPTNIHRDGYPGNFRSPDGAAILIAIASSGFRLSSPVVWLSTGLNVLAAAILVRFDQAHFERLVFGSSLTYSRFSIVLMAIYGAGATAIALLVAHQSRALAVAGAREALRARRAQHALSCLLQDQHDVRSLLSSVNLNAELVSRGLEDRHPQKVSAEYLREDLRTVSALVTALRERSLEGLAGSDGCLDADLAASVGASASMVARRFADVRIESDVPGELRAHVAGGAILLERALLNLMVNACEGDGTRGAARIWIRARREPAWVALRVEDDGPGFSDAMLREPLAHTGTSKPDGGGLGLFLVQSVIHASSGHVTLGQRPGGGARVELRLPAGDEPKRSLRG
jgi:signal transduction histidine kinase